MSKIKKSVSLVLTLLVLMGAFTLASCSMNKQEQLRSMLTAPNKWASKSSMSYVFYDSGLCKYGGYFDKQTNEFEITDDNTLIILDNKRVGGKHEYELAPSEGEAGENSDTWYVTDNNLYIGSSKYYATGE